MKAPVPWKDVSSYSRDQTERIPHAWEARIDDMRITVHHYAGAGDTWFVTCYELRMERVALTAIAAEAARDEAFRHVRATLSRRLRAFEPYGDLL